MRAAPPHLVAARVQRGAFVEASLSVYAKLLVLIPDLLLLVLILVVHRDRPEVRRVGGGEIIRKSPIAPHATESIHPDRVLLIVFPSDRPSPTL